MAKPKRVYTKDEGKYIPENIFIPSLEGKLLYKMVATEVIEAEKFSCVLDVNADAFEDAQVSLDFKISNEDKVLRIYPMTLKAGLTDVPDMIQLVKGNILAIEVTSHTGLNLNKSSLTISYNKRIK